MIEFFTDPWKIQLLHWTMFQIVSALIQIGFVYFVINGALQVWLYDK